VGEGVAALSQADGGRLDRSRRSLRLKADRELLAVEHPYLSYDLDERRLTAVAQGTVPLALPDGRIDPIEIRIEFGLDYPRKPPVVFDVAKRWLPDDDRHIPADRSFCLYLRGVDEPDLALPSALKIFMLDVICFLEQQLIFDRIGRFPGPQWPHHRDAYALHIVEQLISESQPAELWAAISSDEPERNDPCPCGSGTKYKRCHLDLVHGLDGIARSHSLKNLSYPDLKELAGVGV